MCRLTYTLFYSCVSLTTPRGDSGKLLIMWKQVVFRDMHNRDTLMNKLTQPCVCNDMVVQSAEDNGLNIDSVQMFLCVHQFLGFSVHHVSVQSQRKSLCMRPLCWTKWSEWVLILICGKIIICKCVNWWKTAMQLQRHTETSLCDTEPVTAQNQSQHRGCNEVIMKHSLGLVWTHRFTAGWALMHSQGYRTQSLAFFVCLFLIFSSLISATFYLYGRRQEIEKILFSISPSTIFVNSPSS